MKFRVMLVLMASLLAIAGCVIEPYGRDRGDYHDHEDGHRVWRG